MPKAVPRDPLLWPRRLFIASLMLLGLGIMIHPLVDPDVYIHLRDGRYWVENHFQAGADPFSYTLKATPIENVETLFRVGLYTAYRLGGYNLLIVSKAVVVLAFLFLIGVLIHRRWPHLGLVTLMIGLAVLAPATPIFPERPYIFTYLFLLLVMLLLEDFRAAAKVGGPTEKRLWLIPPLVILWTNLHPGFVVLFVLLGAYIVDEAVRWWFSRDPISLHRLRFLGVIFAGSFLAGGVHPMGFGIYPYIFKAMTSQAYLNTVIEWMPPTLADKPLFFALLASAWLLQLLSIRQSRVSDFILLAVFSVLAVRSIRNIHLFLLFTLPGIASHLRTIWQQSFAERKLSLSLRENGLLFGAVASLLVLVWAYGTGKAFNTGRFPDYHPVEALTWMEEHQLQGNLFTPFHWSGYISWETHGERKVFMDGRLPLFGDRLYADYCRIIYGYDNACLALLDQYDIQIILVSPQNHYKFFEQLGRSGQWALIYWDQIGEIFVRRKGANAALAKTLEYKAVDPNCTPYFNPGQATAALEEIRRAKQTAPFSYLPLFFEGDLLIKQGDLVAAKPLLEEAVRLAPKHLHSLFDLAFISFRMQQLDDAERLLRRALPLSQAPDFQSRACHLMAMVLASNPQRRSEALDWARRAATLMPSWKPAQELVQQLEQL